jgi:hypothetical protein
MNCDFCGQHILATMQIAWNRGNYHPECIGEAVVKYRAEQEPDWVREQPEDLVTADEIEQFDTYGDYADEDYENEELIDELEERLAREPEVSDEVLNQIPLSGGNGVTHVDIPQGGVLVAPRAIIYPPTNGGGHGSLVAGLKGSRYVEYPELKTLPLPETTATFKPVPFYEFVTKLLQGLWDRRMNVVSDSYVISQDGMKLFGMIELENEFNGVRFAIGLRTSNDKSTKLALAVGYKVMCCSNGMLHGDYLPLAVKHSANLELDDALALGIDRIRRRFGDLKSSIQAKQETAITDNRAKEFIYDAFTHGKFPVSLFRTVHSEYFEKPSYDEFKPRTVFSLENAFTTSFKKLQPIKQFETTAKLGRLLTALN